MQLTDLDPSGMWQGRPLCCRYLLGHFSAQALQVLSGDAEHSSFVTWALGTLSDGSREVLGTWPHSIEGELNWQEVFDDLALRGAERIRFAVHADGSAARATFPDLKMLDATLSGEAFAALPQRARRLVRRSEEAAQVLQRRLRQATTRHGPFKCVSAAVAFVEARLADAERRERQRQLAPRCAAAATVLA